MASRAVTLDELKPVSLKRKSVAQGDKVRYRVYTTPSEFVAVIAENALMAMKISGIVNPHRILRDLPLTQSSIRTDSLVPHQRQPAILTRPQATPEGEAQKRFVASMSEQVQPAGFTPMPIAALHERKSGEASILDAQALLQALEAASELSPVVAQAEPESLPASPPAPEAPADAGGLSPEEVEQLLSEERG